MSEPREVELFAMPLVTKDGARFVDTIGAYLIRNEEGARTRVQIVHDDEPVVLLTPAEVDKLIAVLTAMADAAVTP